MWTKDITIWCDDPLCAPEWVMSDMLVGRTVAATRRHAARLGWVFVNGKDLCPEHAGGKDD
jgi:hypothetical protein